MTVITLRELQPLFLTMRWHRCLIHSLNQVLSLVRLPQAYTASVFVRQVGTQTVRFQKVHDGARVALHSG